MASMNEVYASGGKFIRVQMKKLNERQGTKNRLDNLSIYYNVL